MSVRLAILVGGLALAACGGEAASIPPPQGPSPAPATATAPVPPMAVAAKPDVDLQSPGAAIVHGATPIAFDGLQEGLLWPALDKALGPSKPGEVLTLQVARGLPILELLRAAWTLRQVDLRVQSLDASGAMRAIPLTARREGAPQAAGCHLAVFLRPDGSLRVAAPGGPTVIGGDDPAGTLARSLAEQRARCPIKYVAFGSESDTSPWGPVFDLLLAVDAAKAAGDARYVLGQALHVAQP